MPEWRVYTFGYQGRTVDELAAERDRLLALVVDTRLVPQSQIAGWSLKELQGRLGGAYTWIKELGNKGRHGQTIELADPVEGFARLGRLIARHRTVILLCACANLEKCHRLYIAKQIEDALGAGEGWVEHLAPAPKAEQERMAFA